MPLSASGDRGRETSRPPGLILAKSSQNEMAPMGIDFFGQLRLRSQVNLKDLQEPKGPKMQHVVGGVKGVSLGYVGRIKT